MTAFPEAKIAETPLGQVSYREAGAGEGRPVLLALHGLGGNSRSWKQQYKGLSDSFHVIGWDAPGYGETVIPGIAQEDFAKLALALLDHLGVGDFSVIGHSMGGIVAQTVTALASDRARHMILSCTHWGNGAPAGTPLAAGYQARIEAMEKLGSDEYARTRSGNMVADVASDAVRAEVEEIARGVTPGGLKACATMLHHADTRPLAPGIACPVLLISGDGDKVVTEETSNTLAALYPAGRHERLKGAGHAPYIEVPDTYNALLKGFLAA